MAVTGRTDKDANVNLSIVFQISAVILLIASWLLLAVKPGTDN